MMPLHYMRLGGSEFLRQRSAWTAHLMRTSAAQAKSPRPSGQNGVVALTKKTTPVGFEPTRGDPIGLAGRRLNRSAKVSSAKPKDAMIVAQHAVSQHAVGVGVGGRSWNQVSE